MGSNKSFNRKTTMARCMKQNRALPNWIRYRTDNKIRYNAKRRHWRRTKIGFWELNSILHQAISFLTMVHLEWAKLNLPWLWWVRFNKDTATKHEYKWPVECKAYSAVSIHLKAWKVDELASIAIHLFQSLETLPC